VALLLLALPAAAVGQRSVQKPPRVKPERARGVLDVRAEAQATPADPTAAQEALRRSLGLQGVVDVDSLTGTPRVVAKLDGFLTGPSSRDAKDVALDYVREHPDVFLLDEEDLAGLRVTRDYTDIAGIQHIVWAQTAGGIATFDNDLRANVTADGRLVNVLGSPLPDLSERVAALVPSVDATGAVSAALRSVGRELRSARVLSRGVGPKQPTRLAGGHRANLVFFNTPRGVKLAWRATAFADADEVYDTVVDAVSGEVLRRVNEVAHASGDAWGYYPGAAVGGSQLTRTFAAGWSTISTRLEGDFVHVFRDINDDDIAGASEQVPSNGGGNWTYPFMEFTSNPLSMCSPSQCSWDSYEPGPPASWKTNDEQNATQVFYFVNTFHDWLAGAPFGFDAASGNFEFGDKVKAHANDGANKGTINTFLGPGMPDEAHVNNANMLTLPDDTPPIMQMYLFTSTTGPNPPPGVPLDPTPDVNGGDDASIVYHEYTHGLSNRLITYSDGFGALDSWQSGAMGEAWSDWYAMDYLASHSDTGSAPFYADDTATEGEIVLGSYADNGQRLLRTEGLDCPVGSSDPNCPGTSTADAGGYTYGDFGKVFVAGPEVHADGEIWAQTLWDLRDAIDIEDARFLITEAMRLSPPNPSFLDMRNAILLADVADGGTDNSTAIWQVFADRGMGFFAHATNANDVEPAENFAVAPDPNVTGTLEGTVTDQDTGLPLAGAAVTAGNERTTTDAAGQYSLSEVPVATYPAIFATKSGYQDGTAADVDITDGGTTTQNLVIRRDWSARSGGAVVQTFTGPNFGAIGCGPGEAIDQAHVMGWSTAKPAPRSITVRLPKFVDVTGVRIDPGAICGDPDNASTQGYRIDVSKNNVSWTKIKESSFTLAQGQAGVLQPAFSGLRRGVRYVRFTVKSNFAPGQTFIDLAEVAVFGKASQLCLGQPATRVGTAAANTMNGSAGADVIVGLGGNDVINGNGGNDILCGGDGADRLTGHGGVDKFDGGNQNDTIYARDARKELTIRGGNGTDRARKDPADRTSGVENLF